MNKRANRAAQARIPPTYMSGTVFEYLADPILIIIYVAGFRKAASRPWFHSGPEACGPFTNLFEYRFKISHFFLARIGEDFSNFGIVLAKNRRNQFFAF